MKVKALNTYLDEVFDKLLNYHKELLFEDAIVSSDLINSRYLAEDETSKTLRELLNTEIIYFGVLLNLFLNYYKN